MEFHQIRYFLAVCDHMNFTRAAEACGVSQPALTVAIRKLEEELGGTLFERTARQIALTPLGRTMRTHLGRIEETRAAAGRVARAVLEDPAPRIDLGVYSTIGPCAVAPALAAFQQAHPGTEVVLYDSWGAKAIDLLRSGAFDCAVIAVHGARPDGIDVRHITTEPMVLAVPEGHPLAAGPARLADLSGVTYFDRLRCEFREEIMARMRAEGIAPQIDLRSEAEDWVQHAIASGRGTTIVPRDSIVTPGIAAVEISDLGISRDIAIATVRGRPLSAAAGRLIDYLTAWAW